MDRSMFIILAFASALLGFSAATNPISLLNSYNVSNSITGSATFSNITYSGAAYTLVNVSGKPYFLINDSGSGSFVLNSNDIAEIIGPSITASLSSTINLTSVSNTANAYINSSAASINDCVQETGIDRSTCTVQNYCNSCAIVPNCNRALYQTGGPTGVLGSGIMLFGQQYNQLQSNASLFNEYASAAKTYNLTARAEGMNAALANISKITQSIGDNPIFPPPSSASFTGCTPAGSLAVNLSSGSGEWYCNAVGYCMSTTYNSPLLAQAQAKMAVIESQLPTASRIQQFADNISTEEGVYVTPVLARQKGSILARALNTTLSGINATLNASAELLARVVNSSLSARTSALQSNYTYLVSNYPQLNITTYAQGLSSQLSALRQSYSKLNATYSSVLGEAKNNTAVLITLQLSGDNSNQTSALSFREQQINQQLQSQVSSSTLSSIKSELDSISSRIPALGSQIDLSPEALSRAIDGPFVSFIAGATGMSYASAVAAAPVLSALLSLIIGLILLALLYIWYLSLSGRKRIRHNVNVHRAWRILFIVVLVLVALYVAATYAVASAANSGAPISAFTGAMSSSHAVVIAINGTQTASLSACAAQITSYASQRNVTTKTIYLSGASCSGNGGVMNTSECLNEYARINVPVIMLTQASGASGISIYSMYGTLVRAYGDSNFTSSCYVGYFAR